MLSARGRKATGMTLPFQLVACDMDGTILNSGHCITPYTKKVLLHLYRMGVLIVFATGRHRLSVHHIWSELADYFSTNAEDDSCAMAKEDGFFCVSSNGARVHNPSGELIIEHNIPASIVQQLYDFFVLPCTLRTHPSQEEGVSRRLGPTGVASPSDEPLLSSRALELIGTAKEPISVGVFTTDEWIITRPFLSEEEMQIKFSMLPRVVIPNATNSGCNDGGSRCGLPLQGVGKVSFRSTDQDVLDCLEQAILARFGNRVSVVLSSNTCLDVMDAGVSKGAALVDVCRVLNKVHHAAQPVGLSNIIAFGDSMNDAAMLQSVGMGCVMSNGQNRLKEFLPQCDVVACNEEDGVAKKLQTVFSLPC